MNKKKLFDKKIKINQPSYILLVPLTHNYIEYCVKYAWLSHLHVKL